MKKISAVLLSSFLLICFCSCRKNKSIDLNPDVNVANDVILSVSSYTNILNFLVKARLDTSLARQGFAYIDSAYTTYDSIKREYDFNFSMTMSPDSVRRSGQIAVIVSGDILQKDTYAHVFFHDYYEDYGRVAGTDSIRNQGVDNSSRMVFSDNVTGGSMEKLLGGGTIRVKLDGTYKAVASSLFAGGNIQFFFRGNISGVSSKGYSFSASTSDSLVDSFTCPWIKGGIINVSIPDANVKEGYIDFLAGDGCSDLICYYFDTSKFRVWKNQYYLQN